MPSNNIGSIEQIFALQPEGVVGGDINPLNMELLRGGGSDSSTFFRDLDYMDMLEAAEDEELFRMLGVNDATPLEQRQQEAAQKYADLVKRQPTTAEDIAAVDAAKAKLVELDVSRGQLNEAGIDASRGISGVMGPSISGALEGGIEKGSELFGLGAEGIASLIGADKALSSALLNVPKPGVTFVFGEGGQKRPLITGQTPAGTQVGVIDPYGIFDILGGVQEGSLGIEDIIAGGAGAVAAATALSNDDDKTKKTGVDTGVNVTLGDESGADPATKVTDAATAGDAADVIDRTPTDRERVPGLKLPSDRTLTLPDFDPLDLPSSRTLELPDFDPTATERIPTSTTTSAEDKTPADKIPGGGDGGGGGGGGGGLPEGQAGVRTVSGGPGPSVDIDYLYDFARGLEQPFLATEDEEEGDKVKKFFPGGEVISGVGKAIGGLSDTQKGLLGAAVGGIFGGLGGSGDTQGSQGYTGGIPALTASRELVPDAFAMEGRRPGEAGRRYFTDVQYTPVTDEAGLPTIMGGAELAAMNQAALDRQKELSELGQGLLGIYGQKLADEAAEQATEQARQAAAAEQARQATAAQQARQGAAKKQTRQEAAKEPTARQRFTEILDTQVDASDRLDIDEQKLIADSIIEGGFGIDEIATRYGAQPVDVVEGLLRGGFQTPEQIAAMSPELDEPKLIAILLDQGKTDPEEVAAYYKDHPVYGGITPEQVVQEFRARGGTRFAQGGNVNGYYLGGPTDGMADQIPATINNMEPARLSDGEFVIPADVVSHLGNGNSDAGAENLYSMMERVRKARTGNPKQGKEIDPNKYLA